MVININTKINFNNNSGSYIIYKVNSGTFANINNNNNNIYKISGEKYSYIRY